MFYNLRRKLAKKFNIPFLTGRDQHLSFDSEKKKVIHSKSFILKEGIVEQLIFLHIPKTAGSSVINILKAITSRNKEVYLKIPVSGYSPAIKMNSGWRGAWDGVQSKSKAELDCAKIITGHFPFGIPQKNGSKYFTLIRHPVDREISSFNYLYQTAGIAKECKFEEEVFKLMDNPQTRIIAGVEYMKHPECDETVFKLALENLKKSFLLYGPAEKTDDVLSRLLSLMGWPSISYYPNNLTKVKLVNGINSEVRKKLETYHKFDLKLHNHACEHWNKIVANTLKEGPISLSEQQILNIPRD